LTGLLVVEGWMKPIWPKPALRPSWIEHAGLKIRITLKLWYEIERGFLPPIHLATDQSLRGLKRIGKVPPDNLVKDLLLATC